ncbi:MAG: putative Type IV pilus pilin [Parcubacteria bacterium C7867-007]|nr:MAG: putative Type IV pilus pilin [Parcubacteria bacterium C7867-007]
MIKARPGFTLVETLVAIAILTISIAGPYYSIYKAVQTTYIARDKLIATSLAQEGAEYVRNVRDSNFLYNIANISSPVNWMYTLTPCRGVGVKCTIDVTGFEPPTVCASTCAPLNLTTSNLYSYNTGTPTRYTRSVNITDVSAAEVTVTVTVTWKTASVDNSLVVTQHLYNWL